MTKRPSALAWLGLAGVTLLCYFQYPGHVFLESDTQIYVPMLERFRDATLFERDPMVVRAHTAFTLYDEAARVTARLTGGSWEAALGLLHVLVRLALLAGVFLMTRAMGLSEGLAVAAAGVYALGGRVLGPAVLLIEYEPVPRAFALGLTVLALGLAAHGRYPAASVAGAAAFLFHPTTAAPYWTACAAWVFVPDEPEVMKKRIGSLVPLAGAMVLLRLAAGWQPGVTEHQVFLGRVDGEWEELIRQRASYVWVSMWPASYFYQYGLMLALAAAAYVRLRRFVEPGLRFLWVTLCALAVLSLPASYLLLEKLKWAMLPQAQPLRTILFLELFALLGALVTAFELACKEDRPGSAVWWAASALAIGIEPRLLFVLAPLALGGLAGGRWRWAAGGVSLALAAAQPFGLAVWRGAAGRNILLSVGLGAALAGGSWLAVRRRTALAAVLGAVAGSFFLIPGSAHFHWSGRKPNPELDDLSRWARTATPRQAVFLFADAGRSLEPGVFRALACRALYVDWKGGGQINFFPRFAREWRDRWQVTLAAPYRPERLLEYRRLGIDYVVLGAASRRPDGPAEFENRRYAVYRLGRQ